MHCAPSVSHPVGRSAFVGWFLLAVALCGLTVHVIWTMSEQSMGTGAFQALSGALWGGLLLHAVWRWWRMPTGTLTWQPVSSPDAVSNSSAAPTGWWWCSAAYPDRVSLSNLQVTLRLNNLVVLRWRLVTGRVFWVCVQRQEGNLAWHALQRALTAHAS